MANIQDTTSCEPSAKESLEEQNTIKKLLKYCQEVVTKQDDSNDNIMEKVILFGEDFESMGLKGISVTDDWFYVEENDQSPKVQSLYGMTDQRQLFYDLFNFHRRSKLDGGELVCGIGIACKLIVVEGDAFRRVWHPVILIHLEMEELGGRIRISPSRIHTPALWSMSPFCADSEENQNTARHLEEKFQKHLQQLESRGTQICPFDPSTYEEFLDEFRRCWEGDACQPLLEVPLRPESDEEKDIDAFWQQRKRKPLKLSKEWVLFSQAGDLSACKKDIQGFISRLDDGQAPDWARFIARKFKDVNADPPPDLVARDEGKEKWLFPLESNEQQQDIADLLRRRHTVVVQGPPGTGKTHTLANLVSDAVAHGRRVLVVSTGQHALEVFLEKLPNCISDVAMFFGDPGQFQDNQKVINAVENSRRIVDSSRRAEMVAQAAADKERLLDEMEDGYRKKKRIESELERRAELLLTPFSVPMGMLNAGPLGDAQKLRESISSKFGTGPLKRKNLMSLIAALLARRDGQDEVPWLDDLSTEARSELTTDLTEKILPMLSIIFDRDLYKEFRVCSKSLLKSTEDLIALKVKEHIVEGNKKMPGVSILANQFLEQLRAGQGKGRGHHARHWKLARNILVQEEGLVRAFPLWVMTTGMVSELLPSTFGLFDLVAMDEASKSEVFELAALLRGEKLLVIGDNKQVSPNDIGFNARRLHELERMRTTVTSSSALQCIFEPGKSIFDLFHGMHVNDVKVLREHFRCTQAIIRFCNEKFYNNELEPLRVSTRAKRLIPPIKLNDRDLTADSDLKETDTEAACGDELRKLNQQSVIFGKMKVEELKSECRVISFVSFFLFWRYLYRHISCSA
jgi:hypothetical protein